MEKQLKLFEVEFNYCDITPKKVRVKKLKPEIMVPLEFDKSFLFDACHETEIIMSNLIKIGKEHKNELLLGLPRYRPIDLQEEIEFFGYYFFTGNGTVMLKQSGIDISNWETIQTKEEYYEWILSKSLEWIVKKLDQEWLRYQKYFTDKEFESVRRTNNIHIWAAKRHDERFVKLLLRNFEDLLRNIIYSKPKSIKYNKTDYEYLYGNECIY